MRIQFYFHTGRGFNSHTGNFFLCHISAVESVSLPNRLTSPSASGKINHSAFGDHPAVLPPDHSFCVLSYSGRSFLVQPSVPSSIFPTPSLFIFFPVFTLHHYDHYEDVRHPYRSFVCRRVSRGRHPQVRASTSALPPAHQLICLSSTE